jgi:predicted Zn-dependent peptidase
MYDDNPNWCVFFNLLKALYKNHPVRIDIAGTTDSISEITPNLLYECYNTFYDLSNMFLCIAGNVNEEKIIETVNKIVGSDKKKEITRIFPKEKQSVNQRYIEVKHSVAMPLFSLGYKLSAENELALKEKIVYSTALEILSGECSALRKKLTDLELINDEFDSELLCGNGYAAVLISGESKSPKTVQQEINNEIENIINNGYEKNLLNAVKRAMYADAVRRFDSTENVVMQMVESAVCDCNMFEELEIIKNISYYDIIECIKNLREEHSSLSVVTQK